MIEMSTGIGAAAMGIGVSHGTSSSEGISSGCRLRAQSQTTQSGGSPSQQSIQQEKTAAGVAGQQQRQLIGRSKKDNCCLCWCCCCSCSNKCLALGTGGTSAGGVAVGHGVKSANIGNNDGHDHDSSIGDLTGDLDCLDGDISEVNLDEIRSWGTNFDRLMKNVGGRKLFKEFLVSEYSDENILFWLACEQFKRDCASDKIDELARSIYEDYISIISPKEVSLDSRVRETINRNMSRPTPHIFDEAQLQIYTLMQRDSYPRFVGSELYRRVARLDSGNQSPTSSNIERREHGSTGAASVGSARIKAKKSIT